MANEGLVPYLCTRFGRFRISACQSDTQETKIPSIRANMSQLKLSLTFDERLSWLFPPPYLGGFPLF